MMTYMPVKTPEHVEGQDADKGHDNQSTSELMTLLSAKKAELSLSSLSVL